MKRTNYEQHIISSIVNRIDSLRVERGYSIYELAQRANLSENTLKSLYKRKHFPNFYTLYRLCEAFEISVWQFFLFGDDEAALSQNEMTLLRNYENLSPKCRELLFEISGNLK